MYCVANHWEHCSQLQQSCCCAIIEDWTIPFTACRYWRVNDPFGYIHCSIEIRVLFIGLDNPQNFPFNGDLESWPHLIHGSFGPQESAPNNILIGPAIFAAYIYVTSTATDRHTDHATCNVCSSRPHLVHCMQYGLIIIIIITAHTTTQNRFVVITCLCGGKPALSQHPHW